MRKQFPLAPGFATTAHAAQGQTCKEGVVMDMHIGDTGDPLTAYIAFLRVQDRHGLFVYRPFPAAPFQKGAKVGKELRLRGRQEGSNQRQRAVRPTKAAKAMAKGKIFQYVCPHCNYEQAKSITAAHAVTLSESGKDAPLRKHMITCVPRAMGMWPVTWRQGK